VVSRWGLPAPFFSVGTSVARIGTVFFPAASTLTSVSNVSRFSRPSVVFADSSGLRVFGERCIAIRSSPGMTPWARALVAAPLGSSPTLAHALTDSAHASAPITNFCKQDLLATFRRRLFRRLLRSRRLAERRAASRHRLLGGGFLRSPGLLGPPSRPRLLCRRALLRGRRLFYRAGFLRRGGPLGRRLWVGCLLPVPLLRGA